ncbi:MAG: alginate O-acetyltransferase complex protein AlgI [Chloroflexota bacterium]|nr:alginate O-acetyltransferase complex protein AlgI [Chloroflexota bacterium]
MLPETPALVILPFFMLVYWLTRRHPRWNNLLLLLGGYGLYAWGHVDWALLLFLSSALDYLVAQKAFPHPQWRKPALVLGLALNVGTWLVFKYGTSAEAGWLANIGLPLGISFYLLRKLAFLLDSYRGRLTQPLSFVDYALYVSFYPQIFSGPIERPDAFLAQLRRPRDLRWERIAPAFPLLLLGLFKKMAIADNLGIVVDRIFRLDPPSRLLFAAGSFGFAFELYADFSGYTDLSRAGALLLGFETSPNFDHPYLALTPQDFWNRWHMTFSHWLRDYVFFPLRRELLQAAGRQRGLADWAAPILTMLLSGLWHGTGWTYLLWGLYYGLLLAICQVSGWGRVRAKAWPLRLLSWAGTFALVVAGWGLFRAPNLGWLANVVLHAPWGASGNNRIALLGVVPMILVYSAPLALLALVQRSGRARPYLEPVYYALLAAVLVIFSASGLQDFVYTAF